MNGIIVSACFLIVAPAHLAQAEPDISELLGKLDADEFSVRKEAHKQILSQAKVNPEHLATSLNRIFDAKEDSKSPEMKARAMQLLKDLVTYEKDLAGYGYLGISHEAQLFNEGGKNILAVLVGNVGPNTPADKAGLQAGDVIVGIDEEKFGVGESSGPNLLSEYVLSKRPGDVIHVHVRRNKSPLKLKTKLAARPKTGDAGEIFNQNNRPPIGQQFPNFPQPMGGPRNFPQLNIQINNSRVFSTGKTTLERAKERYFNRWTKEQKQRVERDKKAKSEEKEKAGQ